MGMKDGSYKGAHLETRRAILEMLKVRGGLTSSVMAEDLGISTMAVRQHLHELQKVGDVSSSDLAGGVGRPTKVWTLCPSSSRHFPDRHRELAVDFIQSVEKTLGCDAVDLALDFRKDQQLGYYQSQLVDVDGLAERVKRLAELRSAEGYMAEFESLDSNEFVLAENHCPVCEAASACERLCLNELEIFRECLGPRVNVERTEHIVSGARRCVYRIVEIEG